MKLSFFLNHREDIKCAGSVWWGLGDTGASAQDDLLLALSRKTRLSRVMC